jgi:AcrR family transcriptional regulator
MRYRQVCSGEASREGRPVSSPRRDSWVGWLPNGGRADETVRAGSDSGDVAPAAAGARERIISTAYDLFARHGVRAIGVDRIIAEAGVAKTTLYRHFRSKDDLVLAALKRREEVWLEGWLLRSIEAPGRTPEEQLLAIFDIFDEWFRRGDYEGCLFANSLIETHDRSSPVGAASVAALANIRAVVRGLAKEAGVRDAHTFARQWQILMLGSIIQASEGDTEAALQARDIAVLLIERERLDPGGPAAWIRAD